MVAKSTFNFDSVCIIVSEWSFGDKYTPENQTNENHPNKMKTPKIMELTVSALVIIKTNDSNGKKNQYSDETKNKQKCI